MLYKRKIIVCLGSSCFARGNNNLVSKVQSFVRKHKLEEKVSLAGDHCFESCGDGPNVKIGQRLYQQVSVDNINEILMESLKDLME